MGKRKVTTATTNTESAPAATTRKGKGKGKVGGSQQLKTNDVCMYFKERGIGRGNAHNSSPTQLCHISKDRIRKLVDSKSLEIGDLDNQPTCEFCLKGKITEKPFVGQTALTNGQLDLIHTDVCGPVNTPVRRGFSYFITFTDDHSRYGYVCLMRYKCEIFGRFKEYRFEVENQTSHKGELPPSFWGYALETAVKLLNMEPSKTVPQTPYEIWHGTPSSYKYLTVWGSLAYVRRLMGDKLDLRYSEPPQQNDATSFEPSVPINGAPVLRRTYGEAMSDIDSDKWLEAMEFEMDSMGSNQVWILVDPPKGVKSVGFKLVYKRKIRPDGEVTSLKARLVAKGYTQRPGVDFEETYTPVAIA
ncbi:UNVERIFIED_CONTAM: Retrovirus-related Pol polyprotein from transposon RE2 [Sesamum calycinum]|uniref:Retrovirus-related Pol polyprotein from transposon RE2 n=1 Tax=Sesamum calycinum TaxID=2727403 RepID=A0AAW2J194_9LAMI